MVMSGLLSIPYFHGIVAVNGFGAVVVVRGTFGDIWTVAPFASPDLATK